MLWKCAVAALLCFAAVFSLNFRTPTPEKREILVSAAASLKNAFEEIGALYERGTGARVRLNLGASGLLQKQIESGAPVDLFASAGEKQMDALQAKGYILTETRRDFARNALVLIVPARSPLPVHSFADLVRPQVGRVAIGNPKTVPAGQYAQQTLAHLGVWDNLQPKLVLAETVRQSLDYVARGEADAGFVFASDVPVAHGKVTIAAQAPKGAHSPILYPIAVVKDAKNRAFAQRFIDLTISQDGQAVLKKHGFLSSK